MLAWTPLAAIGLQVPSPAIRLPISSPAVSRPLASPTTRAEPSYAALGVFPSCSIAALQPDFLGKPAANQANPAGAGNAEGNWWTPSSALDTDCDGNRVTATTKLSKECIYEKKTAEIKARQAIQAQNGQYKVEKLAAGEKRAAELAAKKARELEEMKARQAKYANKR